MPPAWISSAKITALLTKLWRSLVMTDSSRLSGRGIPFHAPRDTVEGFSALHRVFAGSSLAAQHDGVRLLEDGAGHVGDFRAGGHGILNHALLHMRRHDLGPAHAKAGFHNTALNHR